MKHLIALAGRAGAGKNTVATMLGGHEISFAEPLKRFCQEVFAFSDAQVWGPSECRNAPDERYQEAGAWQNAFARLQDLAPAWLLQVLGHPVAAKLARGPLEAWFFGLMLPTLGHASTAYVAGAAVLPLSSGHFALVDAADFVRLVAEPWQVKLEGRKHTGYAKNDRRGYMHRALCDGAEIDHANGFGLDNRRVNLRSCSNSQNHGNTRVKPGKFKGVSFDKTRGQWIAKVCVNRKIINLGRFSTAEEAASTYDAAAARYFGEYARANPKRQVFTPRVALQTLGTEFGRSLYENVWADLGVRRAIAHPAPLVVITDCRFVNEAKAVLRAGGEVWRVVRPGAGLAGAAGLHPSEAEQESAEFLSLVTRTVQNVGSLENLTQAVTAFSPITDL